MLSRRKEITIFVSGRPTYAACWKVMDKKLKIVEIYYDETALLYNF